MWKTVRLLAVGVVCANSAALAASDDSSRGGTELIATTTASFYDFTVQKIDGKESKLSEYAGDVCLVVNVASR